MSMTNDALNLSRKEFIVYDIDQDQLVGHYHRESANYLHYYPPVNRWERHKPQITSSHIKKRPSLVLVHTKRKANLHYSYLKVGHEEMINPVYQMLTKSLKTRTLIENLTTALGSNNFHLSTVNEKGSSGWSIRSIVCKSDTDATLAGLIALHV